MKYKKLIYVLIVLLTLIVACAEPLCPAYTKQGTWIENPRLKK